MRCYNGSINNNRKGKGKRIVMIKPICYILGAGDSYDRQISVGEKDYIICADGGLRNSHIFSRSPDLIVGDFDSLGEIPQIENIEVYPPEKDDTDMLIAIKKGLKRGYKTFVILGALGGERADHSIANIQNLAYICEQGGRGFILHNNTVFTAIKDAELKFSKDCKGYISVFSLRDESKGIYLKNLKYELNGQSLFSSNPMGVSNEFTGKEASISVKEGILLVTFNGSIEDVG